MRFYLWRRESLLDDARLAAVVEVEEGRVNLIEYDDPDIEEVAKVLADFPDLPLRANQFVEEGLAMTEGRVPKDDPGYGYAFGQAMARACALELSFRPRLLRG